MPAAGEAGDLRPATAYPECVWPVTHAIHILLVHTYILTYIPLADFSLDQLERRNMTETSALFTFV